MTVETHRHDFSQLDPAAAREALRLLGVDEIDDTGAPEDPDERTSGYLAGILAATQAHIQTRRRHSGRIAEVYHSMFEHFTGHCPTDCRCGRH